MEDNTNTMPATDPATAAPVMGEEKKEEATTPAAEGEAAATPATDAPAA